MYREMQIVLMIHHSPSSDVHIINISCGTLETLHTLSMNLWELTELKKKKKEREKIHANITIPQCVQY